MKKIMLLAAGIVASIVFAACTTIPTQTPAQIAANVCMNLQPELSLLQTSGVFTGGAQETLTKQIQPDVDAVCAAGVTVTTANLQMLVKATLPVVMTVVKNSSLTDQQKLEATLAVGAIAMAINTALSMQPVPITTPAAPAVPASAAVVA